MKRFTFTLLLAFLTLPSFAEPEFPEKPSREHYFVDKAQLLTPEASEEIDKVSAALLQEEQIPIITVTLPSLISMRAGNLSIEQYATALFDHWGIGSKQRNYGILLLVSAGDRRARIELGAGWGHTHDSDAQYIMNDLMVPAFRNGDYPGGIQAGVEALDKMARGLALPKPKTPWWIPVLMVVFLVTIIGVIVSLFKSGRRGWGWALIAGLGVLLIFMLKSSANSGGSGGSFGGGFSGGGGASGSW